MNLKERLDALAREAREQRRADIERLLAQNAGKLLRASELQPPERPTEPARPLCELLPGAIRITNDHGTLLCVTNAVPVHARDAEPHPRGYSFLPEPTRDLPTPKRSGEIVAFLGNDELLADIPIERLAFLDLETTGLSGASGTYPFLIGLGYFTGVDSADMCFVCEQYFMEDYTQEAASLAHLVARLGDFDGFVTFNGKTFDLPLLAGRFIMNRMRTDLERPHLDLLHVARSLYKSRLGGCALGNIERHVLRLERSHDIEGHLVPRIYFDYLNGRWPERLIPVFDHNAQDVISMGALLLLCLECAFDPDHPSLEHAHDMASLGRLHRKRGTSSMAIELLERAALMSRDRNLTNRTLVDLARMYLRDGRAADAADIWRQECARSGIGNPVPWIELAKILEHHLKQLDECMRLVEDALSQARIAEELWTGEGGTVEFVADLEKRRARLTRRLERAARNGRREG